MGDRLRDVFGLNPEYNKKMQERLKQIKLELIADKHCSYCANSHQVPHIEMGRDAGTDTFCDVFNELRIETYPTGQECLFWKLREDANAL